MWSSLLLRIVFWFLLFTQTTAQSQNLNASPEQILADFKKIAFNAEYNTAADILRRWHQPIRYFETGDASNEAQVLLQEHLALISDLTNLPISSTDEQTANLIIIWAEKKNYNEIGKQWFSGSLKARLVLRRSNCFFNVVARKTGHIRRGIVILPPNFPLPRLKHCIVEELTQVMGLMNDNNTVMPSVFNDRSHLRALSWKDEFFLRLLYNPRTPIGLKILDAEPILLPIIKEML